MNLRFRLLRGRVLCDVTAIVNAKYHTLWVYLFVARDKEIEIAPGVYFPAWTYNNQVPGPTLRATQGDRIRIWFINEGSHPHTIHFHGWHAFDQDGSMEWE